MGYLPYQLVSRISEPSPVGVMKEIHVHIGLTCVDMRCSYTLVVQLGTTNHLSILVFFLPTQNSPFTCLLSGNSGNKAWWSWILMHKTRLASGWQQNIGEPSKDAESQDACNRTTVRWLGYWATLCQKCVYRIGHCFIFVEGVWDLFETVILWPKPMSAVTICFKLFFCCCSCCCCCCCCLVD